MCPRRVTHFRDTLIKHLRENQRGGEDGAVHDGGHEGCARDEDDDHFLFPLGPVEGVVGVVGGLWNEDYVCVATAAVFETGGVYAAVFLGGIVHDCRSRDMFEMMIFEDT